MQTETKKLWPSVKKEELYSLSAATLLLTQEPTTTTPTTQSITIIAMVTMTIMGAMLGD